MSNNFYDTLGVDKGATEAEIKKGYRKMAMKYHPDKNKGDKQAEKKFKDVNEAYQVLSDPKKKKQYDTFGSAKGSPFSSSSAGSATGFGGFEDLFSQFGGGGSSGSQYVKFDFEDLFGGDPFGSQSTTTSSSKAKTKEPETLDFEKTYEVPVFDMILGCKIEVSGVYGQKAKLKIPAGTKSGTKFRVKDFGKSKASKKGNLIVKVEALMPKVISDIDKDMLERIRENVGY